MDVRPLALAMTVEGHKVNYNRLLNKIYFDRDMGGPTFNMRDWMNALNTALVRANCTTYERVAMFLAQLGAESGSFRYTEELASGSEYNNRPDLGNTHPGDGERYKGRTYIQITGRHNYGALSSWAYAHKYVPTKTYFLDHPTELANVKYIFLGPVWYWTVARNMNKYADEMDIRGATQAVNGGYNNLSGRTTRWKHALTFGKQLLPSGIPAPAKHAVAKPAPKPAPKPKPKPVVKAKAKAKPKPKPSTTYMVRPLDTLGGIAEHFHVKGGYKTLQKLNNLKNPNVIFVGQKLRIK